MTHIRHATVAAVVVAEGTGGLDATMAAIGSQVYEMVEVVTVGPGVPGAPPTIGDAVRATPVTTDYIWIVREGAVPVPDSLDALVRDAGRTDAGIVGSKVVGDDDALLSVGLITDVFGVPYTGLDRSERDQGQYDVVRDVAAVEGTSMLVRRDLMIGLDGLDPTMASNPAAIDLAQRARLKGARIIVSPAAEAWFPQTPPATPRWRDEASRIRSLLKVYGWLTLAWVLPFSFVIGLVEVLVSLFFGRWLGFDFARSWGWNILKLPDTLRLRAAARRNRVVGDAELFRFQRKGSVTVDRLTSRSLAGLRNRLPGDDTLSIDSIGRDVRQPAFIIGLLAVAFVLLSARQLWSKGLPAVGYTLPFPVNGWDALAAYAGGWNPAEFGSDIAIRPLVAIAGVAQVITFGVGNVSEYILGAGAMILGIWGITRLLRTWSIGAAPALLAGIVYVAGPTAQGIAGNTHIGTLIGLGVLPWALRMSLAPLRVGFRPAAGRVGGTIAIFGLLGAVSPLLILAPVPILALYGVIRVSDAIAWRAFIIALAGTAGGCLLLSPWIWDHNFEAIARAGYAYWDVSSIVVGAVIVVAVAAVVAADRARGLVAGWGVVVLGSGVYLSRSGSIGLGAETESAGLAIAGLGLAVAIGIVADVIGAYDATRWRRLAAGVGGVGVVVLLVASSVILLGGRIGLPGDRYTNLLAFTLATEGEAQRSRVLLVGPSHLMPGDSRSFEGGSYRVVSAPVPDLGEARVADRGNLDLFLEERLGVIVSGETRRAGGELAPFGVRWIVILGDSDGSDADDESLAWRQVFAGQLDLLPLSAGVEEAVFVTDIDPVSRALTSSATEWIRDGWVYRGTSEPGRVFVADNPDPRFGPEPWRETAFSNEVGAQEGVVTYAADTAERAQAVGAAMSVMALIGIAVWGRRSA